MKLLRFLATVILIFITFNVDSQIVRKFAKVIIANSNDGNSSFSYNSLQNVTSAAQYNTAFGNYALYTLTTGDHNTAFGRRALYLNSTSNYHTALGYNALENHVTNNYNVAVGHRSLEADTSGQHNIGLGASTLFSNLSGSHNTALGSNSLYYNTTGQFNIGIGRTAAAYNTTGSYNISIGYPGVDVTPGDKGDYQLFIGNPNTLIFPPPDPLIYGKFDNDSLRINNKVSVDTIYTKDINMTGELNGKIKFDESRRGWVYASEGLFTWPYNDINKSTIIADSTGIYTRLHRFSQGYYFTVSLLDGNTSSFKVDRSYAGSYDFLGNFQIDASNKYIRMNVIDRTAIVQSELRLDTVQLQFIRSNVKRFELSVDSVYFSAPKMSINSYIICDSILTKLNPFSDFAFLPDYDHGTLEKDVIFAIENNSLKPLSSRSRNVGRRLENLVESHERLYLQTYDEISLLKEEIQMLKTEIELLKHPSIITGSVLMSNKDKNIWIFISVFLGISLILISLYHKYKNENHGKKT